MRTLVQFAGDDRPAKVRHGSSMSYTLFLMGHDTLQIAERLGRPEHVVLREINKERSREKGLPSPYAKDAQ